MEPQAAVGWGDGFVLGMLAYDDRPGIEERPLAEIQQAGLGKTQPIRGIEEDQIELPSLVFEPFQSPGQIHLLDRDLPRVPKGGQVPGQEPEGRRVLLHKNHGGGASTEGFQPHGAGTGEKVQHRGSAQVITENAKDGLSHAIGCRPQPLTPEGREATAPILPRDDPQVNPGTGGKERRAWRCPR
jgi:hypothetical protein